jgi:putative flippase GtrA
MLPRVDRKPVTTMLKALILDDTNTLAGQLARYLVVGAVAFGVDVSVLIGLTELLHWHYLSSAAAGFCCGLVTNYLLSITWVFRARALSDWRAEFAVFATIGIVGLGWNELLMYGGTDWLGLDYRISKLIAVALVLIWNFGMRKILLFREQES